MICSIPDCDNLAERSGVCATHARMQRKAETTAKREAERKASQKAVKKVSDKMAIALKEYVKKKKTWLVGKKCAVFPTLDAIEPHHMKGKATIELLLDERYWLPVSREGHVKIETNPDWAKEMGFSLSRLETEPHKI